MRTTLRMLVTSLVMAGLAGSGTALATHEGTWHGSDGVHSYAFCEFVGEVTGNTMEALCLAVLD